MYRGIRVSVEYHTRTRLSLKYRCFVDGDSRCWRSVPHTGTLAAFSSTRERKGSQFMGDGARMTPLLASSPPTSPFLDRRCLRLVWPAATAASEGGTER
jgi:hypothetical protein